MRSDYLKISQFVHRKNGLLSGIDRMYVIIDHTR